MNPTPASPNPGSTKRPQAAAEAPPAVVADQSAGAPLEVRTTAPDRVDPGELDRVLHGRHHDPHSVLGPHAGPDGVTLRVLRPWATSVTAVIGDERYELHHEHEGIWVGLLPADSQGHAPDYRLDVAFGGPAERQDDPYRFLPTLGQVDLHLIGEGRHEQLWEVLGAHVRRYPSIAGEITGTSFAV